MVRSLLIALDGSAFAEHAVPLALALARPAGASLEAALVHVPLAFLDVEGMSVYALEQDAEAETREYVYVND
ncbi:MAG TPA: hypothetical protein DDY78_19950 [Planctomycetales bacterium]|jgi:nucleotide-binding universal stress UspA family protein|nr:hypothetical protein [Planctomycetales bacterium]